MKSSTDDTQSAKILDSLSSHIAIVDCDGIIQFVNKAWREFALANEGDLERTCSGSNYLAICEEACDTDPTVEAVKALNGLRELLKGERDKYEMEYPCHSSAQRRWFLMRCSKMISDNSLFVISHIDITKQKEFEIKLNEERANSQAVVDALMIGIAIANLDGVIQFVNPAFAKLYQYSSEELVGMHASEIITPQYHNEFMRFIKEIPLTGYFEGNSIDVKKDGSTFHTEIRGVYIQYKNEPCCLALVNDISDSIKLDEARKSAEELYSALFEENQTVMLLIDPSSKRIIDANPAACRYYGYTRIEMQNMLVSVINALTEEEIESRIDKALSEKKAVFQFKHRLADGTLRDVDVYTGPMRVGEKTLLCSIVHDISERKAIEQEREKLIAQLQYAVDEIKTLRGILPICSFCKKIRDDSGYWQSLEKYISERSEARFSHGLCLECAQKHYPDYKLPNKDG